MMTLSSCLKRDLPSFGGGALIGDQLVRLTYVDEAGVSNPKEEPYLVVAAVMVDADRQLESLEQELSAIIRRFIPPKLQSDFILHAAEIFNGGKTMKRNDPYWTKPLRTEIANAIALLPGMMNLPVFFGWVDRNDQQETTFSPEEQPSQRDILRDQHTMAYMRCAVNVDGWMKIHARDEITLMIVEDNESSRKVIREVQSAFQDRNLTAGIRGREFVLPLRKIKEDPLFQKKRPYSVLQLADFCAYIFKRVLMNPHEQRYLPCWEQIKPYSIYYGMDS